MNVQNKREGKGMSRGGAKYESWCGSSVRGASKQDMLMNLKWCYE